MTAQPTDEYLPTPDGGKQLYKAAGKLQGRKVLLTGGDSGIGRSTAILLAMEGAEIMFTHLESEEKDAQITKQRVEHYGAKCHSMVADLRTKEVCKKVKDAAIEKMGCVNILINNHAVQNMIQDIQELSEEQWENTFQTNIHPFFYLSKYVIPQMKAGDTIINNASINAYVGRPDLLDYTSTKGEPIVPCDTRCIADSYRCHCRLHSRFVESICVQGHQSQCSSTRTSLDATDSRDNDKGSNGAIHSTHGQAEPAV